MPSPNSPVTSALCESRLVGTSHRPPVTAFNSFSFTLLSKNASANHLESHSCKNKGLKVPCFHTLTKKGVGEGGLFWLGTRLTGHERCLRVPIPSGRAPYASPDSRRDESRLTASNSFRITYICKNAPANPYGSHISKTKDLKSFRITYFQKKGTAAGGPAEFRISRFEFRPAVTRHQSRITSHESPATSHQSPLAHQPPLPPLPPRINYSHVRQAHRH